MANPGMEVGPGAEMVRPGAAAFPGVAMAGPEVEKQHPRVKVVHLQDGKVHPVAEKLSQECRQNLHLTRLPVAPQLHAAHPFAIDEMVHAAVALQKLLMALSA